MTVGWHYAHASVVGSLHEEDNQECQDSIVCDVVCVGSEEFFVAVVADGAGSAEHGKTGAEEACYFFFQRITNLLETGEPIEAIDRNQVRGWIDHFGLHIDNLAETSGKIRRDYASTLLVTILGVSSATFFQVGDGGIVVSSEQSPASYNWIFWPQHGPYVNTTFFVTDESATETLEYQVVDDPIVRSAIFTDGIENIALDFAAKEAHSPFFKALFNPLNSRDVGYSDSLSAGLSAFLNSPRVRERSGDDKTLLLVSRTSCSAIGEPTDENA